MEIDKKAEDRLVVRWQSENGLLLGAAIFAVSLFLFLDFLGDRRWLAASAAVLFGGVGFLLVARPGSIKVTFDRHNNTVTQVRNSIFGLFPHRRSVALSSVRGSYRKNDLLKNPVAFFFVPRLHGDSSLWIRVEGESDVLVTRYPGIAPPKIKDIEAAIRRLSLPEQ